MFLDSLQGTLAFFLMLGVGYFLAKTGLFSETVRNSVSTVVIFVALPCSIVYSFYTNFSLDMLSALGVVVLAGLLGLGLCMLLAWAVARITHVPATQRGIYICTFALSNASFIGFPMTRAVFGEAGMPYALAIYISCLLYANSLSFVLVRRDSDLLTGKTTSVRISDILKKLLTAPFLSIFVGAAIMAFDITLPKFVLIALEGINDLTGPLAILFVGALLYKIGFKNLRLTRHIVIAVIGKLVLCAGLAVGLGLLLGLEDMAMGVFVLLMSLSSMIQPITTAQHYGADAEFGTKILAWTILGSLVTIPLTMGLLEAFL